ncbi:MAG TPA: hypothetical protein VNM22_21325 [Candidatus Limnocylindrales bacterium]|nr:hypothetical protein [Candidatus Limnocylindrales bacterium]
MDKKKGAYSFRQFLPYSIWGLLLLGVLLLYVEQQIRLNTLNYEIIALKEKKRKLEEEKKAYELELNSLKILTSIESKARQQGLVLPKKGQIQFVDIKKMVNHESSENGE